jgi:hypothetical protein
MAPVLKALFVGQHRKHTLQSFVSELYDSPTPFADQMFVICVGRSRLVALESLAELVGTNQSALHQQIQRPIYRCQAYACSALLELAPDPVD